MPKKNVIEVIIKGEDQASAVLGKIGGAVSGLGSVAAGVATGGLALAAVAVVGLGAAAVGATVGIYKLTQAAAAVEGTRLTFERLTDEFNGSYMAMQDLQAATRGMVGEADLMAASNKFLTMGITENIEETAKMAEMATQLGLAMGEDATASMENFALMMANQSIPRLDSFGISSAAVRERIKELQAATEGLSREEAFKIAVMEQGAIAMEKVGEQGENAAATTLRWKAVIADLSLGIGQAFIPALEAIRKPVVELVEKYGPDVILWAEMAGDWLGEFIPVAIEKLEAAWVFLKPGVVWMKDMFQAFTETYLPHLRSAWDTLQEGFQEISALYNRELKPALEDLWEALGLGQVETGEIVGAFGTFMGILTRIMASGLIVKIKQGIKALSWAVEKATPWVDRIRQAFERTLWVFNEVRHWISVLVEKFNHFKSTLAGFQLPWWLSPGSPTPLETGLAGIGEALAKVQGLAGGGLTFGGLTPAGAGAGAGGGITTISIVNNFGVDSVRTDEDILDIADAITQELELRGIGPVL